MKVKSGYSFRNVEKECGKEIFTITIETWGIFWLNFQYARNEKFKSYLSKEKSRNGKTIWNVSA